MFSISSKE